MHVSVKVLNGQESSFAVSPSSQVSEVKELVHTLMSIPVSEQKLLYRGKALSDDKLLKDYEIQDGARLTLVVRKSSRDTPSPVTGNHQAPAPLPPVWQKMLVFLKRHFRERDADLVLAEFRKSFERGLSQLSLDDIDRFAANKMRHQ
ncbi:ubiquitin-like protein 4A [Littorina saxatilis]|uniref:Ubiquitin-like domain-containing protein n=1 Tax=Littorina saxatilis TaxID=31220 RepID=A0AAN9BDD8_9CAEN